MNNELENILFAIGGMFFGIMLSYNFSWIIRKFFKIKIKQQTLYYDASAGEVTKHEVVDWDNHIFRFVLSKDKLNDSITLRFTEYRHKPEKIHVHLKQDFPFKFYSKYGDSDGDNITHYKNKKYMYFIDEIFWLPTNNIYKDEVNLSSPLNNALIVLGINNK